LTIDYCVASLLNSHSGVTEYEANDLSGRHRSAAGTAGRGKDWGKDWGHILNINCFMEVYITRPNANNE